MPPRLKERLAVLRQIFNHRWVKVALGLWVWVATYDTFVSQVVPEDLAQKAPKLRGVIAMTSGWLPWWGWLLVLAALIVAASFEYAFRRAMEPRPRAAPQKKGRKMSPLMLPLIIMAASAIGFLVSSVWFYRNLDSRRMIASPAERTATAEAIFRQNPRLTLRMISDRWESLLLMDREPRTPGAEELLQALWKCFWAENRQTWVESSDLRTLNVPENDFFGNGWQNKLKWGAQVDVATVYEHFKSMGVQLAMPTGEGYDEPYLEKLRNYFSIFPLAAFPAETVTKYVDQRSLAKGELADWFNGPSLRELPRSWFLSQGWPSRLMWQITTSTPE
jgi:hypothetical protein